MIRCREVGHPQKMSSKRFCLALGQFDGFHLGHQALLDAVMAQAAQHDLIPSVLLFDPLPKIFLGKMPSTDRLMSLADQTDFAMAYGCAGVHWLQFDDHMASLSPERFVQDVLIDVCCAQSVVVGEDFRFGCRRSGSVETLKAMMSSNKRHAHVVMDRCHHDQRISSSWCRAAWMDQDFDALQSLLGRPYALTVQLEPCLGGSQSAVLTQSCPALQKRHVAVSCGPHPPQHTWVSVLETSAGQRLYVDGVTCVDTATVVFV